MIAKTTSNNSISKCAEYLLGEDKKAEILHCEGCIAENSKQLTQQFQALAENNERVKKPLMHHSLSFAEQNINSDQMKKIAQEFAETMGYEQYTIIQHNDTNHKHVHLMCNRVRFDGSAVANNFSKTKAKQLAQELEKKYKLQQAVKVERVKQINSIVKGKKQERQWIYDNANDYFKGNRERSLTGFIEHMEKAGIDVSVNRSKTTDKISGLSFQIRGQEMKHKASQVHSDLKWSNFSKSLGQGLNTKFAKKFNSIDLSAVSNPISRIIDYLPKAKQVQQTHDEEQEREEQSKKYDRGMSM